MGRRIRPHLPGATFHLTARLHDREALFTSEVRTALLAILREQVTFGDTDLFAYVVMPNHLHLVVRQGKAPLSRFMQPLLRRVALLVQRAHRREGYVFERPYRDRPCTGPDHLRNAIVYTHLNPVRAGLCTDPGGYAWSSHGAWVGSGVAVDGRPHPISLEPAARVFASAPSRSAHELCCDYRAFLAWRLERDRLCAANGVDEPRTLLSSAPPTAHGDANWLAYLAVEREPGGGTDQPGTPGSTARPSFRPDLGAIARDVLQESEPGLIPAWVRSRWGGPAYVRARHTIIRRAAAAGYRGRAIARYLRISTTTVSDVLSTERKRLFGASR